MDNWRRGTVGKRPASGVRILAGARAVPGVKHVVQVGDSGKPFPLLVMQGAPPVPR